MSKKQYLFNVLAFVVAVVLVPFLLLLNGCYTTRAFDYPSTCGQDDCGKEP